MAKLCKIAITVFLLLILALIWNVEAKAADDDRARIAVAIYADGRRDGMTEDDAQLLTDILTNVLMSAREKSHIRVYERSRLDAALIEHRLGSSHAVNEATIMRLGEIVGVQYVFTGSVISYGVTYSSGRRYSSYQGRCQVSLRLLDVTTGELLLSFTREGSSSSESRNDRWLNTQAIRYAMENDGLFGGGRRLARQIREALEKQFPIPQKRQSSTASILLEQLQNETTSQQLIEEQPAIATQETKQPAIVRQETIQPEVTREASQPQIIRQGFNPNFSDEAEVIETYYITSEQAERLIKGHKDAVRRYEKADYKDAYDRFRRLLDDYDKNYLAAYWAGESAKKRGNKTEALKYYNKALEINPKYEPARRAKEQINEM